jgi:predicted DNA binding CopG/RHH family protein
MVSIRIPADLLEAFKVQAYIDGTPYQTLIKKLMREWVLQPDSD